MNLFRKQKQTDRKQTNGYGRGNTRGRDKSGAWDEHTCTAAYKTDNQQGYTI